jgi:hypothetical protein
MRRVGEDRIEVAVARGAAAVLGWACPATIHAVRRASPAVAVSAAAGAYPTDQHSHLFVVTFL